MENDALSSNAQPIERRLATIMMADVAGYSRMMGEDEEGTVAVLRGHRENRSQRSRHSSAVHASGDSRAGDQRAQSSKMSPQTASVE